MADFTVSSNKNFDDSTLNSAVNGDNIIMSGTATLTINSDSRWGQTAAVITNYTATTGNILIDATDVWWIPFDASSGNVPSLGTLNTDNVTISGGNVGEFLGVFTALGVSPSAAGGAMPGSGFIKLRYKSGTIADNDVLTFTGGATATVNSTTGGQRGWLNIVTVEGGTNGFGISGNGKIETQGDWFYLADTDGTNDQTIQYYVADACPAIQVETSSGSGVYEWWCNAGITRWGQNNRVATDARGKLFGCSTAGVITLARTSGGITCGQLPPSSCKVRVPNIHLSGVNASNYAANLVNATISSRARIGNPAAGGGLFDLNYVSGGFYFNTTNSRTVSFDAVAYFDSANLANVNNNLTINNTACGIYNTNTSSSGLNFAYNNYTNTISNSVFTNYSSSVSAFPADINYVNNLTITNCKFQCFGNTTAATLTRSSPSARALRIQNGSNINIQSIFSIGANIALTSLSDSSLGDLTYADLLENNTTQTTNGIDAVILTGCIHCTISDIKLPSGISNVHPYLSFVNLITNSSNNIVENLGTAASPLNGGSANACNNLVTTTNAQNNIIRRCYMDNTRASFTTTTNTSSANNNYIDVWGDAADSSVNITSSSCIWRGIRTGAFAIQPYVVDTYWANIWTSTTAGRLYLFSGQFYTSATLNNQITINAGTPVFSDANVTSSKLTLTTGDQITYEMPYYLLGATSFTNTNLTSLNTDTGSHTTEYQIDTGSGWNGSWVSATGANLSAETINATTGFKLKIRVTCTSTGIYYGKYVSLTTDSTSQKEQYPLPGYDVNITGLVAGSEVRAYLGTNPATSTAIDGIETSSTSYTFNQNAFGSDGYIRVFALGYQDLYIPITYSAAEVTIPVFQVIDRQYLNP
jgi:hypothetical protein